MVLLVAISILLVFFWTGVYSAFISAAYFYQAAPQIFGQVTFWAVICLSVIISLMPRFCIKVIQKVYFPRDIDVIREQVRQGKFAHLDHGNRQGTTSSVDEDQRPIYPPSAAPTATTHNRRSQNGSDGTAFTQYRSSLDPPLPRPSIDRARPSFESIHGSMDRMRPSYEQSNDFTSAAMLTRIESSYSFGPV
jgi:phospholipid-translocating ATPase